MFNKKLCRLDYFTKVPADPGQLHQTNTRAHRAIDGRPAVPLSLIP